METAALIGSETLLGREVRDIVATGNPGFDLRLVAADEEAPGKLTRIGDELATVVQLDAVNLADAAVVVLAGSPEFSKKALELTTGPVVDLTHFTDENPEARLRAPFVEQDGEEDEDADEPERPIYTIAHPAAIALALFLRRLQMHDEIRRAVIDILVPASEHGMRGVEELQQQTVSLLSFKSMPKTVFDSQLGYNLLAKYGEEAPRSLEEVELRIERHLATLLALPGDGEGAPMPSLRVVQAPVFHGYSFSAWVQFEGSSGVEAIESGLASAHIEVLSGEFEPPTNVGQAGQSGIAVGGVTADRNDPDACWFWIVTDNMRLTAENAVAVVKQLI